MTKKLQSFLFVHAPKQRTKESCGDRPYEYGSGESGKGVARLHKRGRAKFEKKAGGFAAKKEVIFSLSLIFINKYFHFIEFLYKNCI